jgi:hypothetical protein
LEGGWEEWGLLADALAKGRRDERDQAVPSGGLAGIFHYDGSFSFYECPVLEEGSSDQLWRQSGLAGGSDEVKWESRVSQSDFEGMVVAAQERIRAGDIYQINLIVPNVMDADAVAMGGLVATAGPGVSECFAGIIFVGGRSSDSDTADQRNTAATSESDAGSAQCV